MADKVIQLTTNTTQKSIKPESHKGECYIPPSLINLLLSDIPTTTNTLINLTGHADDITITATHNNYRTAETIIQP